MDRLVSIPFKREGVSKLTNRNRPPGGGKVSIPFKREGVSKLRVATVYAGEPLTFLFPSSGKAFPNSLAESQPDEGSDRFYSLQAGRRFQTFGSVCYRFFVMFVSIPFKREGVSKLLGCTGHSVAFKFLFPSTGKAFPI